MLPSDHPFPLYNTDQVAHAVGLPLAKLNYWFYKLSPRKRYNTFPLKRRSGGSDRIIHAPIAPIKRVQRQLAERLAAFYSPSTFVHGYVAQRSIVTNASVHQRQVWVLRVDLTDFFPSINFGRVRGMLMAPPFDYMPQVATILAHICCHENAPLTARQRLRSSQTLSAADWIEACRASRSRLSATILAIVTT